ncbi:MAG: Fur family transcriptional regulator [Thermoanaerobacteraceae bacterium]|nr:Fur family transcriptional regulator [Thermoanaerobacteraceae bacterium]
MEDAALLLKKKGIKVTPQRLAIYYMLKNTKSHPSADTIYQKLSDQFPTMSLATVYKTLDLLNHIGLIQEINVGEDCFRYDANTDPHPHIICLKCKRVEDVENHFTEELKKIIANKTHYNVVSQQLYFYGYCPECSKGD